MSTHTHRRNTRIIATAAAGIVVALILAWAGILSPTSTHPLLVFSGFFAGAISGRLYPRNPCAHCTALFVWPEPAVGALASNGKGLCKEHAQYARLSGQIVIEPQYPLAFPGSARPRINRELV